MPDVTLTDAQLAEIDARAKAATPGPWIAQQLTDAEIDLYRHTPGTRRRVYIYSNAGYGIAYVLTQDNGASATAEQRGVAAFIAHARIDIPALLAALRASREREKRYETALREITKLASNESWFHEIARAALGEETTHA